jgi:transcriptional regulator with XRE-family HTH domain
MGRMLQASTVIRDARRAAGLTQAGLASRMGVAQSVVARLEAPGSNPTWETVSRALRAAGHELSLAQRSRPQAELDLAQLRERLRLTPGERLRAFESSQRNLRALTAKASRRHRD